MNELCPLTVIRQKDLKNGEIMESRKGLERNIVVGNVGEGGGGHRAISEKRNEKKRGRRVGQGNGTRDRIGKKE